MQADTDGQLQSGDGRQIGDPLLEAKAGMLLLSATLKNRAAYAQAWPLLEITLTDTQDAAVVRRVLQPADYLPPQADPTLFPPNGEVGLRLWLEAKETAAAGYRLYVFYP